jgi:hypothetical protein
MKSACTLREESRSTSHYAMLDGSPQDLRLLADCLRRSTGPISLDGDKEAAIVIRHTSDDVLRISKAGSALTIEGSSDTVNRMFIDALEAVADEEEAANGEGVARHRHIEYLGDGDKWRAPDSLPLIVGSTRG